ncbi:MAG: HAD family phosphatase [Deltaproteobacteria bacterium]|jgi:phosphoserine phosphatase|nr:MAG: HAD family phosphatase [Deltaproteobacteria bacterium]
MTRAPLKLAIFDIDGTLRRVRDPWIHLHHHLGVAEQAKDLPDLWKRGEITYEEWARLDASFWRGHSREKMVAALKANPFRDGARELIGWFSYRSIPCVGISSGLSIFNEVTSRELGMEEIISNELEFDGDIFNGTISIQVHEHNKGEIMDEVMKRYSVREEQVVAFGDGTADIPLLIKAGLGVAICPLNEKVRSSAEHVVGSEPIDIALPFVEKHFKVG